MRHVFKTTPMTILVSLIFIAFQNCSNPHPIEATRVTLAASAASGNGVGYDGKQSYVLFSAQVCADGSKVKAQIDVLMNRYTLTRDNCRAVAPENLSNDQVRMADASGNALIYGGELLTNAQAKVKSMCLDKSGLISFYIMSSTSSGALSGVLMEPSAMSSFTLPPATVDTAQTKYSGQNEAGDTLQLSFANAMSLMTGTHAGTLNVQFAGGRAPLSSAVDCYQGLNAWTSNF